ncbi:hypothetical protein OHD78_005451 [Klebsiella pneumoniae]|uniref:hypothetical protein n=1 Tax=Klebsiella pneumoniae TaxID=573 RepID=UPI000BA43750|nr:hypothetical protein [Klebsiella pneumoniae]EKT0319435.1 hypothetical protein [Klebsiella pneumoniae]EKW7162595.1 hypothetical protein [Klebsiella pneumoniae]PAB15558.1 hypothetical protein CDA28_17585 [Klebsiella pneumoniae]PAB18492.1 hypothetical protein CDA37_22080 [Klebsiella pneumoniae]
MNVFNSNDYERACIWYERIKYCVEKFNIKIEILREKLAVDLLNNQSVNYFHADYQSIIDNFETEVYHIIEKNAVDQQYLPFLFMIIEEYADLIYDLTSFVLRVLSHNGFHEPHNIPTFGYEVYEAIGLLNLDIEDIKEQTIYKYHKMDFSYHDWHFKYGEQELMNSCAGFECRVARLFKDYGFDKTCIPVLMAIIINEADHIYGFSDYGFLESLIKAIENRIG